MSLDSGSAISDAKLLEDLEGKLVAKIGGLDALRKQFPKIIRKALDEVIDAPRTGRLRLDQIEKTEKTYIGTKVEILFRNLIGYPKGIFDLNVDGVDVDIKNTVGTNWTIPPEILNKICVLISCDEKSAQCNLGLIVIRPEYLSKGENRDHKRTIAKSSFSNIRWLLKNHPYEKNIWESVSADKVGRIFDAAGGTERLVRLFTEIQKVPISRAVVEGIAQQKDYMKRLRKNGGARDKLAANGIALLSGKYDKNLIKELNLPHCTGDEFISYQAVSETDYSLLRNKLN